MKTHMQTDRGSWLEIDTAALIHNYTEIRNAANAQAASCGHPVKVCAVLKADCYGMGTEQVAKVLEGLASPPDAYAVACLSEAMQIRKVTPLKEVLILGYVAEDFYPAVIENEISIPIYRKDSLEAFNEAAAKLGKKGFLHIAVNTGMNRLGFAPTEESADIVKEAFELSYIEIRGIFTHLAAADEADKTSAHMQMQRFDTFLAMLKERGLELPTVHAAASPAICDLPEYYKDMVRGGLLLAGCYASEDVSRERIKLHQVVKWKARLGNVMPAAKGEGVGYGFTYHLPEDTLVGLLPVGFSDGLSRSFSNNFFVTIRGHKCPIIGRICMDHCMIDLKDVPDPKVGEEIVIIGDGLESAEHSPTLQELADIRGTIPEEVMANITARIPRIFL